MYCYYCTGNHSLMDCPDYSASSPDSGPNEPSFEDLAEMEKWLDSRSDIRDLLEGSE